MTSAVAITASSCLYGCRLDYRLADGPTELVSDDAALCGLVRFEHSTPVRPVRSHRGQRNFCGDWWMATTRRHAVFESWVERDFLIAADFAPEVVSMASQPFVFTFGSKGALRRSHVPDFFLRLANGDARVVDVRPAGLIKPADEAKFAATEQLCAELGWSYRLVGDQPAVLSANLRWLAGYRFQRAYDESMGDEIMSLVAAERRISIDCLAARLSEPVAALPTIFHLLWRQCLRVDLDSALLTMASPVQIGALA